MPLQGIGPELVELVAAAEFLAVLGSDTARRTLADYEPQLRAGIERKRPMVCANPDPRRCSAHGMVEAGGARACRYEPLGLRCGELPAAAILRGFIAAAAARPRDLLPAFVWSPRAQARVRRRRERACYIDAR